MDWGKGGGSALLLCSHGKLLRYCLAGGRRQGNTVEVVVDFVVRKVIEEGVVIDVKDCVGRVREQGGHRPSYLGGCSWGDAVGRKSLTCLVQSVMRLFRKEVAETCGALCI